MTATINSASTAAALRIRYKDGVEKEDFSKAPTHFKMASRETDFDGESYVFALNTDGTQGLGTDIAAAIGNLQQSPNARFAVTRVRYYGLCRVTGEAMKAAKGAGAMLNLWEHEVERTTYSFNREMAIQWNGNGDGVRGTLAASSSGVASATVTLADDGAINSFSVGMRVQGSATAGSALLSPNAVTISGIDRVARTLTTTGGNWSTQIPGLADGHKLYRYGDGQDAGTKKCLSGVGAWLDTAALFGLTRTPDPIKYGGQQVSVSGVPMEEVIPELASKLVIQGAMPPDTAFIHPDEGNRLRKALIARSGYVRGEAKSVVAGVSFKGFEIDGPEGPITVLEDINRKKATALLTRKSTWKMKSLGSCPQILDFDKQEMLRTASDDCYELRMGQYGNAACMRPVDSITASAVGA